MRITKPNVVAATLEKFLVTTLVGFLFALVVGLPGCAATGPLFKKVQAPEGKAVLYFYRKAAILGSALTHDLYVNGEYLAEIPNGGYIPYVADPGQVNIYSTQMRDKFFRETGLWEGAMGEYVEGHGNLGPGIIEVRANEIYFFRYEGKWGTGKVLRQVSKEIGNQDIRGLNLIPSPPDSQDNQPSREGRDNPR